MKVHSKVRMPSPRLSSLTSRITRNRRKKLTLIIADPLDCSSHSSGITAILIQQRSFLRLVSVTSVVYVDDDDDLDYDDNN